jgi:RimJ/RimL family protein N-acetyltransferase
MSAPGPIRESYDQMQGRVIRTKRLTLRPLILADAPAIAQGIGQWEVIRWLTRPPYPYALADAVAFLSGSVSAECFGIDFDGTLAGVIGLHLDAADQGVDLGYWLGLPFHGQGYMTEAASAAIADHFTQSETALDSGYIVGNSRSENVLTKLGFTNTQVIKDFAKPLNREVNVQRMVLTRSDWLLRKPH